jgi:chromosome segregation ATPase
MAESIRFSSQFTTLNATGIETGALHMGEYSTKQKTVIDDGPGHLSDKAMNCIKAAEDAQHQITNAGLSESLEQAENFTKMCDINNSLAAKVKELEAAEPIQGPNNELEAAHQEIDELREELQIDMRHSAKLERRLEMYNSDLSTAQTDVSQLRLEQNMLLHHVKNIASQETELQSKLRLFKNVIQ